ncbi:MAG: lamin tail domain-containing protein [Candidatus Gracilibacteria bacterium]
MNRVKSIFGIRVLQVCIFSAVLAGALQISYAEEGVWEWTIPTKGTINSMSDNAGASDVYTVVINEVYANPDTTKGEKEFMELYNYGSEAVSLNKWSLTNKNGTIFTINDEVTIGGKGYVLLEKSVSMNNSGDTITLKSTDGTERDMVEYTKTDLVKGKSLSRFCDVYELLFCSLESTPATPGNINMKDSLEVMSDHIDGSYPFGTKIILSSSNPDADIYYSLDGNNPDPASQEVYKGPLVLEADMDILFYAVVEGRSSKIEEAHFRVERGLQKVKNYGAKINEVYLGSGSTIDNSSWMELTSSAQKKIDISGWMITTEKEGKCTVKSSCIKFDANTFLYSKNYKVLSLSTQMQSANVFYLLDSERNIADEIHIYPLKGGQSFARYNNTRRIFTTQEVPALYGATDFPTQGKENIIAYTYLEDKDGDMLNKHDEEYFGTLTSRFDSNKNGLPDFYDKGQELTGGFQKYFYKKLLADMIILHAANGMLTGRTLPAATVGIYTASEEFVAEVRSDALGNFSWDSDGVVDMALIVKITDINKVQSFASAPFIMTEAGASQGIAGGFSDLKITALFPNPDGTDTKASEWIEIQNTGKDNVELNGLIISINDKDTALKSTLAIASGEKKKLSGEDIAKTIPNSGTIALKSQDGVVIDTLEYTDPGAGETITVDIKNDEKVTVSSAKTQVKTAVKSTVKVLPKTTASIVKAPGNTTLPNLKDIAIENVSQITAGYSANVAVQGDVVSSEVFTNTHPVENEKNIVLALLGGFMSTMSGFIFLKF